MTTTTIREEMTTLTTSDSVRPAHTTINLSDKEKGGLSDEETGGGVATVDVNLRGRVGDAANEEKIRTTATEKEKERARARATRRTAVAGGGMGSKTMTTEGGSDGRRRQSGHWSRDNRDGGDDGDSDGDDPTERL
jgi:hypothetical protein